MSDEYRGAPRLRRQTLVMALAAAILMPLCAAAGAEQALSADEISREIVGHEFQGRKGIMSVNLRYARDGTMTLKTPIGQGAGSWMISGNQLCVTLTSGPRKGQECLTFTRQPNGRYLGSNGIRLTPVR
ncbi:MAG TPA: hypothetical protein VIN05_14410 [Roseovarius sp.]